MKINAQTVDSTAKWDSKNPVFLPVFPIVTQQSSILFSNRTKVHINWGNPFSHWGVMCVGEYKLEKKTGIPFRFRLGSLDYVNKLEGKK